MYKTPYKHARYLEMQYHALSNRLMIVADQASITDGHLCLHSVCVCVCVSSSQIVHRKNQLTNTNIYTPSKYQSRRHSYFTFFYQR